MTSRECTACSPEQGKFVSVNSAGECVACGKSLRNVSPAPLGARGYIDRNLPRYTIAAAEGIDTTGLCTVREWAEAIIESGIKGLVYGDECFEVVRSDRETAIPYGEMSFTMGGKRYNIETLVTVEDLPSAEDEAMQAGYDGSHPSVTRKRGLEIDIPPEQERHFSDNCAGFVPAIKYGARKAQRGEIGACEDFTIFVRSGAPTLPLEGSNYISTLRKIRANMRRDASENCRHPGFYWTKIREGGRWEISEWDGVAWNNGDEKGNIFLIGDRAEEPA